MHSNGHERKFPPVEKSTCAAVISAYRPPQSLVLRVENLLAQFSTVVVVDDSGTDERAVVDQCRRRGAITIHQARNTGIAAALNRGVAEVRAVNPAAKHVVTFDQDSAPSLGFLEGFESAASEAEGDGVPLGSISPGIINETRVRSTRSAASYDEVTEPIQSGTLIPLRVLEEIGGFDESLFIDGVDTDAYWRMRSVGYVAIAARAVRLEHELGTRSAANVLGRELTLRGAPLFIMQSAPFRYYYLVRNRCELTRRYIRSYPLSMVRGIALDLRHLIVVLVLGSARSTRMRFMAKGLVDGFRGIGGSMAASTGRAPVKVSGHE
jgi:rhamnosyltransferase